MTILDSIRKGIDYIEQHLESDIGVSDVANAVSYSQFYFSREFARYTHISVYDYIIRRKLAESYKRLFRERSKIVDIAFRYGFQSHEGYTRAFRKAFGENPSDAAIYKPFAIFEPIDEQYLRFLYNLKAERKDLTVAARYYFEVEAPAELNGEGCYLVLLAKDTLLSSKGILRGCLRTDEPVHLSFRLHTLRHAIRFLSEDTRHGFRYFLDNVYDSKSMCSNYILAEQATEWIDILTPTALPEQVKEM